VKPCGTRRAGLLQHTYHWVGRRGPAKSRPAVQPGRAPPLTVAVQLYQAEQYPARAAPAIGRRGRAAPGTPGVPSAAAPVNPGLPALTKRYETLPPQPPSAAGAGKLGRVETMTDETHRGEPRRNCIAPGPRAAAAKAGKGCSAASRGETAMTVPWRATRPGSLPARGGAAPPTCGAITAQLEHDQSSRVLRTPKRVRARQAAPPASPSSRRQRNTPPWLAAYPGNPHRTRTTPPGLRVADPWGAASRGDASA